MIATQTNTVRLTRAQADALFALEKALGWHTDTTCEIACYDNSAPGTGQRLLALQAKGLCKRGRLWSRRAGYSWTLTEAGKCVAEQVRLRHSRLQGFARQAGEPWHLVAFNLAGTYTLEEDA